MSLFGKCAVCAEKDLRIQELKEQIAYFKSVLNPPPRINKYELQEDMLLEGGVKEEIIDTAAEALKAEEIRKETDALLTGNYEEMEIP